MAKSSSKRPSRVKPSPVKKSPAKGPSKAKKSPLKPARTPKKSVLKKPVARKAAAKKPAIPKTVGPKPTAKAPVKKPLKPALLRPKPAAKAPAPQRKIAAKPVVAPVASTKTKAVAPSKPARQPPVQMQIKAEPFKAGPSVATNLKPRKSQIGLTVKELEHFADQLLAKRRELVGDMSSMEREALRSGSATNLSTLPMHMADMGTDNFEQEFTLGLVEKDRSLLREINNALSKIQNGTYGICEGTGIPISKARLEAAPWARFSIEYARQKEKNGMGVRTL